MLAMHASIKENITKANELARIQANKKRIKGLILKEGDKIFISTKNLKTKRLCKKFNNLRVGPFRILEK
jgi:hypothetical protein